MSVQIAIVDGPIPADTRSTAGATGLAGACLSFDGIVRATEEGRQLVALNYQAYEPMASRQLTTIAEEVLRKHGLLSLNCWHSRGRVPVGQCSLRAIIEAPHRGQSLAAMAEFINRLKKDVPIWKSPVWV